MDKIFMNFENIKTIELHKMLLHLSDKRDLHMRNIN